MTRRNRRLRTEKRVMDLGVDMNALVEWIDVFLCVLGELRGRLGPFKMVTLRTLYRGKDSKPVSGFPGLDPGGPGVFLHRWPPAKSRGAGKRTF